MGQHSRVELVTTAVVDHHSTSPTNGQDVLQSDREYSSTAPALEEKVVEQIDLRLLMNQQVRAFAHSAPALQSDDLTRAFDSNNLASCV